MFSNLGSLTNFHNFHFFSTHLRGGGDTSNIRNRVKKGVGIVTRIIDVFGHKYFEITNTSSEAEIINGILTNV